MELPQVQISTTDAKLGLTIKKARVDIQQPNAEVAIEQTEATQRIEQKPAKLTIDQSNAWRNLDLKNILERTRELAEHGNQTWMENLAKMAGEGDELMRIEYGGNPIASQAKRNAELTFELQPDGMPVYDLVSIHVERNEPIIQNEQNLPKITTTRKNPEFIYERGSVTAKLEQFPTIDIDVKNLKFKGTQGFEITI
ncbi:DUF6470 family protein [Pontibacillus salicampi]|uniref:DUF6470 family protein n=1 Tax=Pontibacillus salicampi TaxID=1449801 RepID=A0ABV6LSP4_9BACI